MDRSTPAQAYCLLIGLSLILGGIVGFLWNTSFGVGDSLQSDKILGLVAVNGWHNVVHILTGLLVIQAFAFRITAKYMALLFGATYAVVAILGLVMGDDIFGFIPINGFDNLLHIAIAVLGIVAGLISKAYDPIDHLVKGRMRRQPGTAASGARRATA